MKEQKTGIDLIAKEREEQILKHGITIIDDANNNGNNELINAAIYLLNHDRNLFPPNWSHQKEEKLEKKHHIEKLIIAGALIAAELDRLEYVDYLRDKKYSDEQNN